MPSGAEEEEGANKERKLHKPLVVRKACYNHHLEMKPGIPIKFLSFASATPTNLSPIRKIQLLD